MRFLPALLLPLLLLLVLATATQDRNITRILAKHPEFSTFNHYLTVTHLAGEINRRRTITVCVVDNAAMNELLDKHYNIYTIKNILSLHVFADYFGSKKLHQITKGSTTTSTLFQATGEAAGTSGYVNITDLKGGKVGFSAGDDGEVTAKYVKSVEEWPYNLAVIQISHVLTSPEAEAPSGAPSDLNVTTTLAKQGCQAFADLLTSSGAADTYAQTAAGGLTVFCPKDEVIDAFMPKYKNLTSAGKVSLLLYHGVPVYQSLGMLRSNNGVMNTLATEGASKKYDFTVQNDDEDVKLKTKVVTATITGTVIDKDPLAVFKVDKVLLPPELFKAEKPAPAPKAEAPKAKGDHEEDADAPEPAGDDEDPADQTAEKNGAFRINGAGFATLVSVLLFGTLMSS